MTFLCFQRDRLRDDGAPAFGKRLLDDVGICARRARANHKGIGKFRPLTFDTEICHAEILAQRVVQFVRHAAHVGLQWGGNRHASIGLLVNLKQWNQMRGLAINGIVE